MDFPTFAQQIFNGLSISSIYALVAVGITLVFGLTGLVNFAHGEFMMIGAYATYVVAAQGGAMWVLALFTAMVIVGVLSYFVERGLFRFTLEKPINGFLISLGLILVIQNLAIEKWSINPIDVEPAIAKVWEIGTLRISSQRVLVIVIAVAVFAALYVILTRTRIGIALRAAANDRETVALMAVPVSLMITLTFIIGGVLAGAAGALLAILFPISPLLGSQFVIKGFAVALVGGLGNVAGAILAALVLGLAEAMIAGIGYGNWADLLSFGLMIVILLVRPQGFLRGTEATYD